MKKLLFSAAIAALALTSCKKDKGDEAKAITKENIIGTYKLTALEIKALGQTINGLDQLEACQKDDLHILKSGDEYQYSDVGTKCDPDGSGTGSWILTGNIINIDGEYSGTVSSLTSTQMVVTESATEGGITYSSTMTFTRQ